MTETATAPEGRTLRSRFRAAFGARSSADRAAALKERIYVTLTGLAIVTAAALGDHHDAPGTMLTLSAGVLGIAGAGLVAEVIAHQVGEGSYPSPTSLARMLRVAAGATSSALLPFIVLAASAAGLLPVGTALLIAIGLYFLALVVVVLIGARRTRLSWRQQLASVAVLAGAGAIAVMVLVLGH